MQFIPTKEHLYWWPIKIKIPHPEKAGQWQTETFEMQFVMIPSDEANRIAKEIRELATEAEREAREHDQLLAVARDWRQVVDADKQPVPFSPDMLLAMLKAAPWYRIGIYQSYAKSLVGDEARRGN